MRVLFIGDLVGKPSRIVLERHLANLLDRYKVDFTIANAENSAGGVGLTKKIFDDLYQMGIDAMTMGNHTWDNKDIFHFIDGENALIRPANYVEGTPGRGYQIFTLPNGQKIAVLNLLGQIYMNPVESPFSCVKRILPALEKETSFIIVDFHAEATSEKIAMGWYLDGRVSAVLGTHTHVPTADFRILPQKTAYITDVGMTGPMDSVLGMDKDIIIKKFTTALPQRFELARGNIAFNAVLLELDENGRAEKIERIHFVEPSF